jgi:hypothetical protein
MKLFIPILFSISLFGCSHTENVSMEKLDVALQQKVSVNKENKSDDKIEFIGACNKEIDDVLRQDIKSTGIEVNSVSKDIFTGRGNYVSILKLSEKDFIKFLRAPRELKPN